jgi:hypothetical protein
MGELEQGVEFVDGRADDADVAKLFLGGLEMLLHLLEMRKPFLDVLLELLLHLFVDGLQLRLDLFADRIEVPRRFLFELLEADLQLPRGLGEVIAEFGAAGGELLLDGLLDAEQAGVQASGQIVAQSAFDRLDPGGHVHVGLVEAVREPGVQFGKLLQDRLARFAPGTRQAEQQKPDHPEPGQDGEEEDGELERGHACFSCDGLCGPGMILIIVVRGQRFRATVGR